MAQRGMIFFKEKDAPEDHILMYGCTKETEEKLQGPFIFTSETINKGIPVPLKHLDRLKLILSKWGIKHRHKE